MHLQLRFFAVMVVLSAPACALRDSTAAGDSSSGSESGGTSGGAMTSLSGSTTTTGTTTDATVGSTTTTATTSTTEVTSGVDSSESFSFITAPDFDGGSGDGANGESCTDDGQCASGFCHGVPGPGDGACSECLADADCDAGTCSFEFDVGYAICTAGELGDGCDSDKGCQGELVCSRQFGDSGPQHCSECGPELPCVEGSTCAPVYGDTPFQGYLSCILPGTVDLGGGCVVVDGVGDGAVCLSGACGVASVMMGNVLIGVCSECDDDLDCAEPQLCLAPTVSFMDGTEPGVCG